MTKSIFYFISAALVTLPIFGELGSDTYDVQIAICFPLILLIGIPHGAIDHIIFAKSTNLGPLKDTTFILIYLAISGMNLLLWHLFPQAGFVLFLLLSAFHFGESQFIHYFKRNSIHERFLMLSWGVLILSGLMYFKHSEILQISSRFSDFALLTFTTNLSLMKAVFGCALALFIGATFFHLWNKQLKPEQVAIELVTTFLILLIFKLLPLLISFTLYFIILHSGKVLREEFVFLKKIGRSKGFHSFIKNLFPLTISSLLGIALVFFAKYIEFIEWSYAYALLVIISCVTVPHAYVMSLFYQKHRMDLREDSSPSN